MRQFNWTKANEIAGPTTCILTAVILVLMIWPMIKPAIQADTSSAHDGSVQKMERSRRQGTTPWIMPSILAGALLVAGFLHYKAAQFAKPSTAAPITLPPIADRHLEIDAEQSAALSLPGRLMANIKLSELFEALASHTKPQLDAMVKPYIGTWIVMVGSAWDIHNPDTADIIVSTIWQPLKIVMCHFTKEHKQECLMLRRGNEVRIAGQIDRLATGAVHLVNCEFV